MSIKYLEKLIDSCNSESDWNLLIENLEISNFNIVIQDQLIDYINKKVKIDDDLRKVPKRWIRNYLKSDNELIWLNIFRNLNLSKFKLNDKDIFKISQLGGLDKILRAKFYMNNISNKGAKCISESNNFSEIKFLNLTYNNISAEGANQIISNLKNLKELYLGRNKLGDIGAKLISKNPNLEKLYILDLRENEISNEGIEILTHSQFSKNLILYFNHRQINSLKLYHNDFKLLIYQRFKQSMRQEKLKKIRFFWFLLLIPVFITYCYSFSSEEGIDSNENKVISKKESNNDSEIIQKFQRKYLLKKYVNKYSIGYYYLWWKTNKDTNFVKSKTLKYISNINTEILGVESYVVDIMRSLAITKPDESKFEIPLEKDSYDLTFLTFDNKIILLTLDKEFGLSFHFRKEDGEKYRDAFLNDLYNYVKAIKTTVKNTNKNLGSNHTNSSYLLNEIIKAEGSKNEVDKVWILLESENIQIKENKIW